MSRRATSRARLMPGVRPRLHDRMDRWLETREARVQDPQPTLEELTEAVFALRQELTQAVTEGLVSKHIEPRWRSAPRFAPSVGGHCRPEAPVRLCVIADGARWIWKQAQALFPSVVEMLDDYHCREHLHKVAGLQYGAHPERQHAWCEAALARLFYGEVHGVIWGLQRMKPTDAQGAEEIAGLIRYLQRHQERLDYRFARKGGYPMGSGGIESANTCICHVRLKRSGAWWDCDQRQPDAGLALREIQRHL